MALLGNLTGSSQFFNPGSFYNGVATTSLRFDKASSAYLTRTPSSTTNRRTWTLSLWFKKTEVFTSVGNYTNNLFSAAASEGSDDFFLLRFSNQNTGGAFERLEYYNNDAGGSDYSEETTSGFRDVSSWYHFVVAFDTTQSTAGNRMKFYVNGVEQDTAQYYGQIPQNHETRINQNHAHNLGRSMNSTSNFLNGYMAEVNFVDGTQYDASYFGETKNGVWIAKTPSVTYGTNGYRLQFKQTGTGTASSSTIGADTSGNDNHWTSSGIGGVDCALPDSPENNFATMNSIDNYNTGVTYSEGNLKWTIGSADGTGRATFVMTSGKWYTEFLTNADYIGVVSGNADITTVNGTQTVFYAADGTKRVNSSSSSYGASYSDGDIIGIALNMDDEEVTFYKNNSSQGTISLTSVGNEGYTVSPGSGAGSKNATANFGQDSSFAGAKTAQGNADGNGIGDFYYAPPSGYLALCSSNLPELTIGPNSLTQADDHFDTLLYTGNNEVAQDIGGLEFKPDWVWIKGRSYADHHAIFDSSRGVGQIQYSNGAYTDGDDTSTLDEFRSDGFGVGTDSAGLVNKDSETYVAWNWKANGGTTTTNDASATSVGTIDSVYQANTTAGFSIVTYTGTGSNATVAHGLGATPDMVIYKIRDTGTNWAVWHKDLATPTTGLLELSTDGAELNSASYWNSTIPTSTVLSIGTYGGVNASSPFIAYCFAGIEGYSKFGSYIANNSSSDNTFIHLGFRPAFVLVKSIALTQEFAIVDNVRDPFNDNASQVLYPNYSNAENTDGSNIINLVSNGFKITTTASFGYGTGTYIYMAFAEAPFKYANAR